MPEHAAITESKPGRFPNILQARCPQTLPPIIERAAQSQCMTASEYTPAVRQQVAHILLQRAPTMNRTALENMVGQTVARLQRTQSIVRQLGRAAAGGLTDAGSGRADNPRTLR
jgi:hypothetical protein